MSTTTPVACPKCGHVRSAEESAPAWQCPACGIAYHKYPAYLETLRARGRTLVLPPGARDLRPGPALDGSVWALLAANVFAVAIALWQHWGPAPLMLLYWGQSVIIGVSNVFRILSLERFSTENFTINDQPVEPTTATKLRVAGFFALHYGFFHAVYFVFVAFSGHGAALLDFWFFACTAAFALNHVWSYRYNRDLDRQGTPNIGTLMFTPYLRIVPMHLTIVTGGLMVGGHGALLLFGALKTAADIAMHVVEHSRLSRRAANGATTPAGADRA